MTRESLQYLPSQYKTSENAQKSPLLKSDVFL